MAKMVVGQEVIQEVQRLQEHPVAVMSLVLEVDPERKLAGQDQMGIFEPLVTSCHTDQRV
jgi:hypothetical protein